jgi:2-keto-4-pentenoate hydratase
LTLASAIANAHRTGIPFPAVSAIAPVDFEAAEAVQAEVARLLGAEIAGWKVGMAPGGDRPVSAPLFQHLLLEDGGTYGAGQATFVAIEVEIGFRILSDDGGFDDGALQAFVGIEVVRSRFTEGPAAPYTSFLADNIANGAYVAGPARQHWSDLELAQLRCRVWRDEELVHDAVGGHPQGHPLVPLKAHWSRPPSLLGGFRKGQIITTGTLCGVMRVDAPCRIRGEVEGFGRVSVDIRAGEP